MAKLVGDESRQQRERAGELGDRSGLAPADRGRLHQRVHEQQHPAGGEQGAENVEVLEPRAASLGRDQPEDRAENEQHGDRVDEHHPTPSRSLDQQAAKQDADRRGEPRDATPDPEGGVALLALLEARGEDRERGGERHRRPEALREPGPDENLRASGEAPDQRRDADYHYPGDQDAAPAEQVGRSAAEQHEPAVGEQVATRHPLQSRHREVQGPADRWKRDVDDRRVDKVKERDPAQQRQHELAAAGRQERGLRGYRSHGGGHLHTFICKSHH